MSGAPKRARRRWVLSRLQMGGAGPPARHRNRLAETCEHLRALGPFEPVVRVHPPSARVRRPVAGAAFHYRFGGQPAEPLPDRGLLDERPHGRAPDQAATCAGWVPQPVRGPSERDRSRLSRSGWRDQHPRPRICREGRLHRSACLLSASVMRAVQTILRTRFREEPIVRDGVRSHGSVTDPDTGSRRRCRLVLGNGLPPRRVGVIDRGQLGA